MSDAVERLVNLALYLADATEPVTAARIKSDVFGYPADQDETAFLRMFERDKKDLRAAGFTIEVVDESGRYQLNRAATFASALDLSPEETAAVRAAGAAMLADPSFPYPEDLRLALTKISTGFDSDAIQAAARLADEEPARQGAVVAMLADASSRGKRATFGYTNSYGASAPHAVEPYGLFLHDGRWYLVGRDTARDEVRTYTVARIDDVSVDAARPNTPDFARPQDFDVRRFVRLPFQYGPAADEFEAVVSFSPSAAWRAEALCAGQGTIEPDGSGVVWHVTARSPRRLLRFALENGPGIRVTAPLALETDLHAGLTEVIRLHG